MAGCSSEASEVIKLLDLPEPALASVIRSCGADAAAVRGACSHLRSAVDAACTRLTILPAESDVLAAAVQRYPAVRELRLAGWDFCCTARGRRMELQLATLMNAVSAYMPQLVSIGFCYIRRTDSSGDESEEWHRCGRFSPSVLASIAHAAPLRLARLELGAFGPQWDLQLQLETLRLLSQPAFRNLRHMDLDLFQVDHEQMAQLAVALPHLYSLRIRAKAAAALEPLSALTALTGLSANVHVRFDAERTGSAPVTPADSGVVALAALTTLRSLRLSLYNPPNAWAWHAVRSLTALTSFSIHDDYDDPHELNTDARLACLNGHPSLRRLELQDFALTLPQLRGLAVCPCLQALSFHTLKQHSAPAAAAPADMQQTHAAAPVCTQLRALTALTALTLLGRVCMPVDTSFAQLMPGLRRLHINIVTEELGCYGWTAAEDQLPLWGWVNELGPEAAQHAADSAPGIFAHPTLEHVSIKWPYAAKESEAAVLRCLWFLPRLFSVLVWGRHSARHVSIKWRRFCPCAQ